MRTKIRRFTLSHIEGSRYWSQQDLCSRSFLIKSTHIIWQAYSEQLPRLTGSSVWTHKLPLEQCRSSGVGETFCKQCAGSRHHPVDLGITKPICCQSIHCYCSCLRGLEGLVGTQDRRFIGFQSVESTWAPGRQRR